MTDDDLIERFEQGLIAAEDFHHCDHVHLAFAYLKRHEVLGALQKFVAALKQFADRFGKTQLYHETITFAYFFLIRQRMALKAGSEWDEFCAENPDLLLRQNGVLGHYYNEATLKSEPARRIFHFPDKNL